MNKVTTSKRWEEPLPVLGMRCTLEVSLNRTTGELTVGSNIGQLHQNVTIGPALALDVALEIVAAHECRNAPEGRQ